MPPITKDSATLTGPPGTAARSGSVPTPTGEAAIKQQPVAVEVPVAVNGVRTVEGSDKREPFSESTKTVMVHGSGAVIRLTSSVAPGQLLFLTNERTKKEVVCQVVKSKNYRSASGYVELEFTEPAVGFWGMRFPGDRIGPATQPAATGVRPTAGNGSAISARPTASQSESCNGKPMSPAAPTSSIVPPPIDSESLLSGGKQKPGTQAAPVTPVLTTLGSETPLVEPWRKKPTTSLPKPGAPQTASPASKTSAQKGEGESIHSISPTFGSSRPSDQPASLFAPAEAASNAANLDLSNLTPFFEVKPTADTPPAPPQAPAAKDSETEELRQHTARLQQELSTMAFGESGPSSGATTPRVEAPSVPIAEHTASEFKVEPVHESPAQVLENSNSGNVSPVLPEPLEITNDVTAAPVSGLESLEQEELKIPAWLAPLARNTAAPSSTEELILREKTKRRAQKTSLEEVTAEIAAPVKEEPVAESRAPQFGSALPFEEAKSSAISEPRKSGKGMLFVGVAAGIVLLAGGGWWYMNQQGGVHAGVPAVAAPVPAVSTASENLLADATKEAARETVLPSRGSSAAPPAQTAITNAKPQSHTVNTSAAAPASPAAAPVRNAPAAKNPGNGKGVETAATAGEPAPAEAKKTSLGDVHFAKPKVSQKRAVQNGTEAEIGAALSEDQPETNPDSMSAGLGVASSQPVAPSEPVAVGGDVKQAKLISSIPPVYPALAKSQHVSGSVTIDALIDANGRVTTMKVMSGPTLLQQAAMDALKQWKYRPATLDGKTVPMHLNVTIQFRLQQ